MDKITNLSMDLVVRPKQGQRIGIDEDVIRGLAESIKEKGLLQPILVRKDGDKYEIVAGDRRFLAQEMLGIKKIKAIVRVLDDKECFQIRAIENLQREDLSPVEEGFIYKEMRDRYKISVTAMSKNLGISQSTIIEKLKIIEMEDFVTKAIHEGRLSARAAVVLSRIEEDGPRNRYLQSAIDNGINIRTAEFWFNEHQKLTGKQGLTAHKIRELEYEDLKKKHYGACDICEEPCESQDLRAIVVCRECLRIIITKKGGV
ncbi:Nucleoid occlusion protein [subsurface metagenome]